MEQINKEKEKVPAIRFKGFNDTWEQRKLGDIVGIYDGVHQTPKYQDSGIMFLSVENIATLKSKKYISEEDFKRDYKVYPQENDILMTRIGDVGTTNVVTDNGLKAYYVSLALLKYKSTNPYFLSNAIQSNYVQKGLANRTLKTAIPMKINKDEIGKVDIILPSFAEEQEKIGDYFTLLDHLITLHQRKCDQLKNVKKSLLEKMFPKDGEVYPDVRFKNFTDAWEQRKLGDIITEYKETVDSDCTLPILTSSKTEGVILQEEHFGRKQQHDITGYNILPRNYCTYRNRSDGVDFTFNINKCCDKGIISKFYPVFSGKNSDVFFLSLVLNNSDEVVREIAYTCTGTGQKVLSFLDLQKMNVRVPNFDEQKEIVAYFDSLNHLITLHQRKVEQLKKIKSALLGKMFV